MSTHCASSTSIVLVFLRWVFIIPFTVACLAAAGFALACWLGDGTIASLYRVEYFMPLPVYCLFTFAAVWAVMIALGLMVTVAALLKQIFFDGLEVRH